MLYNYSVSLKQKKGRIKALYALYFPHLVQLIKKKFNKYNVAKNYFWLTDIQLFLIATYVY